MFRRLTASFAAARALQEGGLAVVLAPTPTADGRIVDRLDERFTLAVHPFLHGRAGGSVRDVPVAGGSAGGARPRRPGAPRTPSWPHPSPTRTISSSPTLDEIPVALDELAYGVGRGPLRRARTSAPGRSTPPGVQRLLVGYEQLAEEVAPARRRSGAHPRRAARRPTSSSSTDRFLLIDWDTALLAARRARPLAPRPGRRLHPRRLPPQHRRHAVTGRRRPVPPLVGPHRDRRLPRRAPRPHTDTTDIAESWKGLQQYLDPAERWPGLAG